MKKIYIIFSSVFVIVFFAFRLNITTFASNAANRTQAEAVDWIRYQGDVNAKYDFDHLWGPQCVELIWAYYDFLGETRWNGDAFTYSTEQARRSNWEIIYQATPQPGDILIYSPAASNDNYGHVGIYVSDYEHYHQNVKGKPAGVVKLDWHYNFDGLYWGVLRPWPNSSKPQKPSAPTNVKASVVGSKVTVSWDNVENATNYKAYIVEAPWGWENIIAEADTASLSHTFTLKKAGSFSTFIVAINDSVQSEQSLWKNFNIDGKVPSIPVVNGDYPAYYTKNKNIKVSWNNIANAEYYMYWLTRVPTAYAYSSNDAHGSTTSNSITFSDLVPGKYSFFVRAYNGFGSSTKSEWKTIVVDDTDYIPVKSIVWNNHIYALYDNVLEWTYADELCKKIGGHLVTIGSEEENNIVNTLTKNGAHQYYWIGMRAEDPYNNKNNFYWTNNEKTEYSNWASGEPNGAGEKRSKEGFTHMYKNSSQWNDVSNVCNYDIGFVLEIDMDNIKPTAEIKCNNKKYVLYDYSLTWSEAKIFSEAQGGRLAVLNNENEYEAICELLQGLSNNSKDWYFIGASRDDNKPFYWLDGSGVLSVITDERRASYGYGYTTKYNYMMIYRDDCRFANLLNYYKYSDDMNRMGFICEIECPYTQIEKIDVNNFNVKLHNFDNDCTVIFVTYKGDRLVEVIPALYEDNNIPFTLTKDYDTFKVMVWDSLNTLKPLCEANLKLATE